MQPNNHWWHTTEDECIVWPTFVWVAVIWLLIFCKIWWATSIALYPSISLTIVGVLFCMEFTNSSSSFLIEFTSGTCGFEMAIVLVPLGVSNSKLNVFISSSFFNFIISAVLLRKSTPIFLSNYSNEIFPGDQSQKPLF